MLSFIRKIIVLVLLLAALALALKFYVEHKLNQRLNQSVTAMAPFLSMGYQRLDVDVDGGINVYGVSLEPRLMTVGTTFIEKIRFSTGSKWFLVNMALAGNDQPLPPSLSLEIQGVDSGFLGGQYLQAAIDRANEEFKTRVAPSCGDIQFLSMADWKAMGAGYFKFDLALNYAYSAARSSLEVSLMGDFPSMAEISLKAVFGGVTLFNSEAVVASVLDPVLQLVELDYLDRGYTRKANRYCAEKSQLTVEDYIDREVSRENAYFVESWGVAPGKAVREAYKVFLTEPGSINFAMYPAEDFKFEHLSLYAPKDWPQLLKLSLLINDQVVTPLEFSLDESTSVQVPSEKVEGLSEPVEEVEPPRYVEVGKKQLVDYIGYKVRVFSINGRMREGTLEGVRNGNIEMTAELSGHKMGISVSVFSAERVEVYK